MPIKVTHSDNTFTVEHRGEVVEVRTSVQSRNHSDTQTFAALWKALPERLRFEYTWARWDYVAKR